LAIESGLRIRAARPDEAGSIAPLLYEIAPRSYTRFAGSRASALRFLEAAFARVGSDAAAEVTSVAELDGRVAGAKVAFPASEIDRRQWMTMRVALSRLSPWRWPRALRLSLLDRGAIDGTPPRSFYVDSLITVASERRRGVARALLSHAEANARRLGFEFLVLDTRIDNEPARALYEGAGFEVRGSQQPRSGDPEELLYVKLLGATRPAP
jgi:ribosomal protein S18 acetylase RimI-like enzyme